MVARWPSPQHDRGADVVIASRNFESCVATAEEIATATGRTAFPYQVHVGRWDQLDGLVEAASYERFGKVDVLINNAGMSPLYDSLTSVTEKLFDAVVNLNLKGPFRFSALVGERMVAAGGGSIVNVSSSGSLRPAPDMLPYAAAKAGLNALTEGLAKAHRPDRPGQHVDGGPLPDRRQQSLESRGCRESVPALGARAAPENPREIVGAALCSGLRCVGLHDRLDPARRRRTALGAKG